MCAFVCPVSRRLLALSCSIALLAVQSADPQSGDTKAPSPASAQPKAAKPSVIWAYKAPEHFVAAPTVSSNVLYVGSIGAFNTGVFHALGAEIRAPKRELWSKAAPIIKRPTVSVPAVVDGYVIFGDGMHQTDDAILYCLSIENGRTFWQLPVPGKLVHLESPPVISKGRVFVGGGDAGVICAEIKRIFLDGKEQDPATVQALIDKQWSELMAKYEEERKRDPEFAMPPSEDALPKPAPKLRWQQGKGKWHVDAALAVKDDRVFACSAFLDEEQVGNRALLCLRADNGEPVWEAPLKLNPWAGATVAGDLVIVGCSSIRFDPQILAKAKGEVVAVQAADGQVKWRVDVPGGVLSRIAVQENMAIFSATDGKVRALNLATGKEKWVYNAGAPLFAGPAVDGNRVYAADLKSVLHAINSTDGNKIWTLDVPADPGFQLPGMVYGSPVVVDGRVYLVTCNVEGEDAGQPSAVLCVSDKAADIEETIVIPISVDEKKKTVSIPCRIAPRQLPNLKDVYAIEVIATYPAPHGAKAHETIVTFDVKPSDVHKALESLGLKPGKPVKGNEGAASGPEVRLHLAIKQSGEKSLVVPIERTLVDLKTGRPLPALTWRFTGCAARIPEPGSKAVKSYGADVGGTLITVYPVTDETVLQSDLTMKDVALLKLETNKELLPPEGTPATLIISVPTPGDAVSSATPGARQPPLDLRPDDGSTVCSLRVFALEPRPSPQAPLMPASNSIPLPRIAVREQPCVLPTAERSPLAPRPKPDHPPLAPSAPAPAPAAPPLKTGILAIAPSPSPNFYSLMTNGSIRSRIRVLDVGDGAQPDVWSAVVSRTPEIRRPPAPFLRIRVPDPFPDAGAAPLNNAPSDQDPPVPFSSLPPRPGFKDVPKAK